MGGARGRPGEGAQTGAMLGGLGVRVREAEGALASARAALDDARRRHEVCVQDAGVEEARMRSIITALRSPEVAGSSARYTEVLAVRDVVAKDLRRERLLLEDAVERLERTEIALAERRDGLARLNARQRALRERLVELDRYRQGRRELAAEGEAEELAALRYAHAHGADR